MPFSYAPERVSGAHALFGVQMKFGEADVGPTGVVDGVMLRWHCELFSG